MLPPISRKARQRVVIGEVDPQRRHGNLARRQRRQIRPRARRRALPLKCDPVIGNVAPVAPLLLGAPKYLAGDMSLGELMQVTAAFLQVQTAFLKWSRVFLLFFLLSMRPI